MFVLSYQHDILALSVACPCKTFFEKPCDTIKNTVCLHPPQPPPTPTQFLVSLHLLLRKPHSGLSVLLQHSPLPGLDKS